jgi:CRP-like cAMP-binding protein
MNQTAFAYVGLTGNSLVDLLDSEECMRLLPFARFVRLEARQTLYAPGEVLEHVYFPAGCVAVTLTPLSDGASVETALIGREGVVGFGAALGQRRARQHKRVLIAGEALRVESATLRGVFAESTLWKRLLLAYYGTFVGHVSRRAICNTRHRLSERLCTWLLMIQDRAAHGDFPLTQETVARQLGVRRAGVNECLGRLEARGLVEHRRSYIRVLDREALEAAACPCYVGLKQEARWFDGLT